MASRLIRINVKPALHFLLRSSSSSKPAASLAPALQNLWVQNQIPQSDAPDFSKRGFIDTQPSMNSNFSLARKYQIGDIKTWYDPDRPDVNDDSGESGDSSNEADFGFDPGEPLHASDYDSHSDSDSDE